MSSVCDQAPDDKGKSDFIPISLDDFDEVFGDVHFDDAADDEDSFVPLTVEEFDAEFGTQPRKPKANLARFQQQLDEFLTPAPTRRTAGLIATDSEWDTTLPNPWLSTAFADKDGTTVFFRSDLPPEIKQRLDTEAARLGAQLVYIDRTDDTSLLAELEISKTRLLNYFSPKDFEYAFGWPKWKKAILNRKVRQRNNLSGKIGHIHLKDLCGWAGKKPLKYFAADLGYPMAHKSDLDDYKECMMQGLLLLPETFLRYAVDDARLLLTLFETFVERVRTMQQESLDMRGNDLWTPESIPMTTGALVARTFERWIHAQAGDNRRALKFCLQKLGILDPDHKHYERNRNTHRYMVERYRKLDKVLASTENKSFERLSQAKYLYTALGSASIDRWLTIPISETGSYNALVHGGRCNNEMPFSYSLDNGLDIDISSCYGDTLRTLTYPIGLPTVWSYSNNETLPTLGAWYDRNAADLIDGLWTCTVSGPLSFEQDLIYSKLVKARDIQKVANRGPDEDKGIDADFALLRREIKNGIITSDMYNVLRRVCSNSEWREIRQLRIVTAAAYLKRDRKADVREWCEHVLQDKGAFINADKVGHRPQDKRTRAWYGIDLETFVGHMVKERKRFKAIAKNTDFSDSERQHASGMDGMLKLFVNTFYGVIASPFFSIGNSIVANNITAKARVGVWMVAKALGLRQTVTDGGFYDPAAVPTFSEYRPCLDTLSRMWEWTEDSRYSRRLIPLFNGDVPADVDALAMAHVRQFWHRYGLTFPYQPEHKTSFRRAAWWSKGDYALDTADGRKHSLRGKDRPRQRKGKSHPLFAIMDAILEGRDDMPSHLNYTRGGLLKIGKFRIIQASEGYGTQKNLRPGDNLPKQEYIARLNNAFMPIATEAEYRNRRNRKKTNHGMPSPWFERFAPDGIAAMHAKMVQNTLRS